MNKISFKDFINENDDNDKFDIEKVEDFPGGSAWIVSSISDISKTVYDAFHKGDKTEDKIFNKVQTAGNERVINSEVKVQDDYVALVYYSNEMSAEDSLHNTKKIFRYFYDHGNYES